MTEVCQLACDMPVMLLVADRADRHAGMLAALQRLGWCIKYAQDARNAEEIAAEVPNSLLLMQTDDAAKIWQISSSIRASHAPIAAAPILAIGSHQLLESGLLPRALDAVLADNDDVDSMVAVMESWRPVSLESTRRIAGMFGAGPIAGMIERLALRLDAARAKLDAACTVAVTAPDIVIDKAEAHRLAGLCGTLGFGRAHAAWLDLSLGETSAIEDVRRTTRLTLSAIARGL
jgi:hypothetical protein